MEKQNFVKMAALGLSSGLLIATQIEGSLFAGEQPAGSNDTKDFSYEKDQGNLGYHLLSEDELLGELNEKGEKLYTSLSPEGKELARKVASQRCNGTNACKGLNACQTEEHACGGHGSCKGQGKCGFSDKNLAVKVAAMKMAEKRQQLQGKK